MPLIKTQIFYDPVCSKYPQQANSWRGEVEVWGGLWQIMKMSFSGIVQKVSFIVCELRGKAVGSF